MEETTRELIGSHVASGARLMARQKQIIAQLKERGVDATEAKRTLAMFGSTVWAARLVRTGGEQEQAGV